MNYLNDFYQRMVNLRRSPNTIESYRVSLEHFFGDGLDFTPEHIESRIAALSHLSTNSLKVRLAAVTSFLEFVHRKEPLEHLEELLDICRGIKGETKVTTALSKEQVDIIMGTLDNLRDKALVKLLYTSGIRVSELTNLRLDDLKENYIIVRKPKNYKDRTVYLPKCTLSLLRDYIHTFQPKDYLFVGRRSDCVHINRNTVESMMADLSTKVGFRVHPHALRRYYATTQAKAGVPVGVLQQNLGHSSAIMSIRYTSFLMEDQEKSAGVFEEE